MNNYVLSAYYTPDAGGHTVKRVIVPAPMTPNKQ